MGNAKKRGRSGAGAERANNVASAIEKREALGCIQVEIEGVWNRGGEGGVDRGKVLCEADMYNESPDTSIN